MFEIILTIVAFILVFSILVLVHECGHFFTAKKSGVHVEEFGFGLPPRAKTLWRDKSGTIYSLNWIPFGGFVKMLGEDLAVPDKPVQPILPKHPTEEEERLYEEGKKMYPQMLKDYEEKMKIWNNPKSFGAQKLWKRMIIVTAGVMMNFILAIVALTIVFTAGFYPLAIVDDQKIPVNSYIIQRESFAKQTGTLAIDPNVKGVTIEKVEEHSLSQQAGFQAGDIVLSINNEKIDNAIALINMTKEDAGKQMTFVVQRGAAEQTLMVTPEKDKPIGIYLKPEFTLNMVQFPFPSSVVKASEEVARQSYITLILAKNVITDIFQKFTVPQGVAGPVGIAQMTNTFVKMGFIPLLMFLAMLSISLGVLNILPFPALDGGRFLFMLFELITRRKPNAKVEAMIHSAGFALLMLLILAVTWNDIARLIHG
jgi:regulator of sigma E protease